MSGFIDAHHHIWRLNDLDWLQGPSQPRIFGDYDSIKKDYLIADFMKDLNGSGIKKSVYIQVNWPTGQEVNEAMWVQEVSNICGWPHALIGYVNFLEEDAAATLRKLSDISLMRGIRQQLHWHQNPQYCFQPEPDLMNNSLWQKNFSHLQDYDWIFELQVFSSQMRDAAKFAEKFPNTTMILQHCGMPEDISKVGLQNWREGMARLAQNDNIQCKFSGLGTFIHRNDSSFIGDITSECLQLFGSSRCLFGSNFPIEKIWTDYNSLINSYQSCLNNLPPGEQKAIMGGNAASIYKL